MGDPRRAEGGGARGRPAIVTVEDVVDELAPVPGGIVLPSWVLAAVVEVPGGETRLPGASPQRVITDLGVLAPDADTRELTLVALHPGVEEQQVREATGWELRVAKRVGTTEAPRPDELDALRALQAASPSGERS